MFTRSEHDLEIILEAVKNGDPSLRFNEQAYPGRIGEILNEISASLQLTRKQIAQHQIYYSYILDIVPSGIIVMNSDNKIITVNKAALKIFNHPVLGSFLRVSEKYPKEAAVLSQMGNGDTTTISIE
ncbi:MAG: PAS domain-containing protein, partial [Paramuribaculum sp.]|nr:PAS domain-containing protein [Paramuribaculum sp.]